MRALRLSLFAVLFTATLLLPRITMAGPADLYGLSSKQMAQSGAVSAAADDFSVLYYNPGRLGFVKDSLGLQFVVSFDDLWISLAPRPNDPRFDVPESIDDATPIDQSKEIASLPTSQLRKTRSGKDDDPNLYALTGGLVYGFGTDWLKAGVAFFIPLTSMTEMDFHYVDEREQNFSNALRFELLNRRARTPSALIGLGARPLDWLGLGLSVNILGKVVAKGHMFVPDLNSLDDVDFTMDVKLAWGASVVAGVQFEPVPWFGIGLSYRDKARYGTDFDNDLEIRELRSTQDGEEVSHQRFRFAYAFSPRQLTGALRFDFPRGRITTDVTWMRWSEFSPTSDVKADADFRDTVVVKAGLVGYPTDWLALRFGGGYVPTPVPKQDGRTNFVDNNRVELSAGASFGLPWVKGLSIDIHGQFFILIERAQWKSSAAKNPVLDEFPDSYYKGSKEVMPESLYPLQTNNPGWPGYKSGGFAGSAGFGFSYQFE